MATDFSKGVPPFEVKYEEHLQPDKSTKGNKALRNKELNAALGVSSIGMDTSLPGLVNYKITQLGDYNYDHDAKHFSPLSIQQRVHPRPMARFATPGKTYSYCTVRSAGADAIPITFSGEPPFSVDIEIKHHGSSRPLMHTFHDIPSATYDVQIPQASLRPGNSALSIRKVSDGRGCSQTLDSTQPRVQVSVHDAPSISAPEERTDYCVGDRLSYILVGQAPFNVYYKWNGVEKKATSTSTTFRRVAQEAGTFTIIGISDSASSCRTETNITRSIHGMPTVRVSKGREAIADIHEGGDVPINFDFTGYPPFEFTWTRSTNVRKGQRSTVLEMRSEKSDDYSMAIRASEEGTYEVVAIKDQYCAYAKEGIDVGKKQKLLTN